MQVRHRLTGVLADVHHHSPAVVFKSFLSRDRLRRLQQVSQQRRIGPIRLLQSRNPRSRDHKHVSRSLRVQVTKRDALFVLIDDVGRNLSAHNCPEHGVR